MQNADNDEDGRPMRTFVTGAVLVFIIHGSGSHGDEVACWTVAVNRCRLEEAKEICQLSRVATIVEWQAALVSR